MRFPFLIQSFSFSVGGCQHMLMKLENHFKLTHIHHFSSLSYSIVTIGTAQSLPQEEEAPASVLLLTYQYMATFGERLSTALGTIMRGYDPSLRRSIQSVALFEAKRILNNMETQRTATILGTPSCLSTQTCLLGIGKGSLGDHVTCNLRNEPKCGGRTGTSKEPLGPETAWKRAKRLKRNLGRWRMPFVPWCKNKRSFRRTSH